MYFPSRFTIYQPPPKTNIKLFADAGIDKPCQFWFSYKITISLFPAINAPADLASLYCFSFSFDAMQTRCDLVDGAGKLPLSECFCYNDIEGTAIVRRSRLTASVCEPTMCHHSLKVAIILSTSRANKGCEQVKAHLFGFVFGKMGLEFTVLEWDGKQFISSVFVLLALDHSPS